MSDIEKIHGITPDLTKENVDRLLALFPDVATEITDPKTGRTERAVDFCLWSNKRVRRHHQI